MDLRLLASASLSLASARFFRRLTVVWIGSCSFAGISYRRGPSRCRPLRLRILDVGDWFWQNDSLDLTWRHHHCEMPARLYANAVRSSRGWVSRAGRAHEHCTCVRQLRGYRGMPSVCTIDVQEYVSLSLHCAVGPYSYAFEFLRADPPAPAGAPGGCRARGFQS